MERSGSGTRGQDPVLGAAFGVFVYEWGQVEITPNVNPFLKKAGRWMQRVQVLGPELR